MTGKSEEAGRAEAWLEEVFQTLKGLTDELLAVARAAPAPELGEVDKRGRTLSVIARAAKAVAALITPLRKARDTQEDDMREDHDIIDDAEDGRLRDDLESRIDHLCGIVERKGRGAVSSSALSLDRSARRTSSSAAADGRAGVAA